MTPALSVIIPTLNEADCIGVTLDRLARLRIEHEVIVVDGGSRDDTCGIAQWCQAKVLSSERGWRTQVRVGAEAATAGILWFLHADTLVPGDAGEYILDALADNQVAGGKFRHVFDGGGPGASSLTRLYRLRFQGLRFGHTSLFVRRCVYDEVGGAAPYPLFEDLDLIRRIRGKGRFVTVPCTLRVVYRG